MRLLRSWGVYAVLLALALAAGLAAGRTSEDSSVPSVANPGPRGLKVLATWLEETGAVVHVLEAPLTALPPDLRTLVIAAPIARAIDQPEADAVKAFVAAGGTLIYLSPRGREQRDFDARLGVTGGEVASLLGEPELKDVGGTTVTTRLAAGLLSGTRSLRVSAERMLDSDQEALVPATTRGALWWKREGAGEVWIAAGPDLAENARLELLDNAVFWANAAARGPIGFDEWHHRAAAPPPVGLNLLATTLQFAFCALVYVLSRGARLGPARASPPSKHRSALEYVRAMASLTATARVDGEVLAGLRRDARLLWKERLGISLDLPLHEAAREVERQTTVAAAEVERLFSVGDFLAASRGLAALEARIAGRR